MIENNSIYFLSQLIMIFERGSKKPKILSEIEK